MNENTIITFYDYQGNIINSEPLAEYKNRMAGTFSFVEGLNLANEAFRRFGESMVVNYSVGHYPIDWSKYAYVDHETRRKGRKFRGRIPSDCDGFDCNVHRRLYAEL